MQLLLLLHTQSLLAAHVLLPGDIFLVVVLNAAVDSGPTVERLNLEGAIIGIHLAEQFVLPPIISISVAIRKAVHKPILLQVSYLL